MKLALPCFSILKLLARECQFSSCAIPTTSLLPDLQLELDHSIVMYECESWTLKKSECRRIDAFELWCWRRLLRVPWTARRSNQSKEISPEYSSEGLMLKLILQYSDHLMWRTDSLEKTLILGKTEGRRRRGQPRMWWLDGRWTWVGVSSGSWWWTGRPGVLQSMGSQRVDRTKWLNWTDALRIQI